MLKLIKFEFLRKRTVFAAALILTLIGQVYALYKYFGINESFRAVYSENMLGAFSGVVFVAFGLLYFIDVVTLFRQDLFKQEGYMLFMTPNSGYKLLGSKLIFALVEGIGIGIIYVAIMFFNLYIFNQAGALINLQFSLEGIEWIHIWMITKGILLGALVIIEFALTVYISFALFKSLFNNTRFKGAVTFGIFLAIMFIKAKTLELIVNLLESSQWLDQYMHSLETLKSVSAAMNIYFMVVLVSVGILFAGTGYLLEKKINL